VVPGGGRGGGALLYPAPPPQVLEAKSPFVLPAVGYRSLGGVFIYAGQLVIVKAPGESGAAPRASDIATGLAFGRLVAEHHIDRLNTVVAADCLGSGERDDPIQLRDIAAPDDSVAAGIACARLRNPGAHWIGSNLMINDRQALSHVVLERLDNTQIDLYMDVSRFARHHGALP
jgi:hypothetical protein